MRKFSRRNLTGRILPYDCTVRFGATGAPAGGKTVGRKIGGPIELRPRLEPTVDLGSRGQSSTEMSRLEQAPKQSAREHRTYRNIYKSPVDGVTFDRGDASNGTTRITAISLYRETRATGRLRDRRAGFLGQSDRRNPPDSGPPEVIQPRYGRSSVFGGPVHRTDRAPARLPS